METPISHYMGYISGLSTDISGGKSFLYIKTLEILGIEDMERLKEVDISLEEAIMDISETIEYKLINEEDILNHKIVTKENFIDYLHNTNYERLFNVYTKDGYVIRIEEQYLK